MEKLAVNKNPNLKLRMEETLQKKILSQNIGIF